MITMEATPRRRCFAIFYLAAAFLLAKDVVNLVSDLRFIYYGFGSPYQLPILRTATEFESGTKGTAEGLELRASVTTAGQFIDTHVDRSREGEFIEWLSEQAQQTITKQSHEKYPLADLIQYFLDWPHTKEIAGGRLGRQMKPWEKARTIMASMPDAPEIVLVEFGCKVFKNERAMHNFMAWLETRFHINAFSEEGAMWHFYRLEDLLRNYVTWLQHNKTAIIMEEDIHPDFHFHVDNGRDLNLQIGRVLQQLLQKICYKKVFDHKGPISPPFVTSGPAKALISLPKHDSKEEKSIESISDKIQSESHPSESSSFQATNPSAGVNSSPTVRVWHYSPIPDQSPYGNSEVHFYHIVAVTKPELQSSIEEYIIKMANEDYGTLPKNLSMKTLDGYKQAFQDQHKESYTRMYKIINSIADFFAPQPEVK